jgi:hypothetical protein
MLRGTSCLMYSGRKSPRFRISAPAMIYDIKGNSVMACTVRDISRTGAGLKLDQDVPLPSSFLLSLTRDGNVRRSCELVWQLSVVAGVRFSDAVRIEDAGRTGK